MFHSLTARVAVSVLLVSLQRVSVVFLPALQSEVRKKGMVRVGVRLVVVVVVVVAGWGGSGVGLMRMVMMMMKLFVFALLVPLLAARSLLLLRNPFLHHVLGALPASSSSSPAVGLPAAGAEWVARGGPGQRREAVIGGEQRGLGGKASQVEVIFLSFIEAVLSIETVAMVIQGTHGEKRRSETS